MADSEAAHLASIPADSHVAPAPRAIATLVQEQPTTIFGCALPHPIEAIGDEQISSGADDLPKRAIQGVFLPQFQMIGVAVRR